MIHLAAQAAVGRSVADPLLDAEINILGSINLLEGSSASGCGASSTSRRAAPATATRTWSRRPRTTPPGPSPPTARLKVAAELYLGCWEALHGLSGVVLRLANIYGPRQNPHGEAGVVAIFTDRLLRGEPCIINGDGLQTRDYVYVGDVAEAALRALERPQVTGPINIGTGVETTVVALFEALRAAFGRGESRHGPARPGEQRRSLLDASRARQRPRLDAARGARRGLRRTVAAARAGSGDRA